MDRHHRRRATALGALATLAAWAVVACGDGGDGQEPQELRREPVGYTSDTPFTPSAGDGEPVSPPPEPGGTVASDAPGLYGGSREDARCDPQQMVDFLESHPPRAEAWAETRGLSAGDIRGYVAELTPVLLRSDTAVTNHGFTDGEAVAIPAVLQAGSAVLVDSTGTPVTKCACGNPLTAPPTGTEVTFRGAEWQHFSASSVTTIESSTTVNTDITLVDVDTGDIVVRPTGTEGDRDTPAPEPPDQDPLEPDTPPPATPQTTTPQQTTAGPTTPDETRPEQTTPDETTPQETTPEPTATPDSPDDDTPSPDADEDEERASWVVGGCAADDGRLRGTLRVRNHGDDPHTYEATVTFGPRGSPYGETTVSTPEVAPDETVSSQVATDATGDAPDGPVDCRVTRIQDDRGETPGQGPPLSPPPEATSPPETQSPTDTTSPPETESPTETDSPTPTTPGRTPDDEDRTPAPSPTPPETDEDTPLDDAPSPTD